MGAAVLVIYATFCLNPAVLAAPQAIVKPTSEGKAAAIEWLALLDEGQYDKSWESAAKPFQSSITKAGWIVGMTKARRFYGRVLSRKFETSTYAANPPGFVPGEYEILRFEVNFRAQGAATELVSMELQSNGKWLVAGYHISLKNHIRLRPLELLDYR